MHQSKLAPFLALLFCLGSLASCEKAGEGGAPKLDKSKFEGVGSVGKVELIGAGSEPRTQLRYVFTEGTQEKLRLDLQVDSSVGLNGGEVEVQLGMNYLMSSALVELPSPEQARLAFSIDDFSMDAARTSPMVLNGMEALKGMLEGMQGSMRIGSRGQIEDATYDMSTVPVAMHQSLSQMQESLKQMAIALPEEPVGVGATWRLYQTLETQGIDIRQQVELELVKVEGSVLHLKTKLVQDADMQLAEMAGLPAAAKAKVSSFSSTGEGTTVLDLKGIVPVSSQVSLKTSGSFELDMGGEEMKMKMKARTKVEMKRE